ncbi:MAG: hypothetical protein CK546_09000 [Pedosphaera sp.]|nr:MAG: hypothetical protein CK546_09000 [Pedosphaera sp.]
MPEVYTWDPKARIHSIGGMGKVGNIDHLEGKAHVELFNWRKAERVAQFPGDKGRGLITHLVFHPQGDWLLGARGDGKGLFMFLDVATGKVLREEAVSNHFHKFALDERGTRIYTAGHNKLSVWEAAGSAQTRKWAATVGADVLGVRVQPSVMNVS